MNPLSSVVQGSISGAGRRRRGALVLLCVSALGVAACGSDDDEGAEATSPPAETSAATVATTEPVEVTSSSAPADSAPATADSAPSADGQVVNVDLLEFEVALDADVEAGAVTFDVENTGQFPHDMHIYRGAYAELPQKDSGAVDDAAVAATDNLGAVAQLDPGQADTVSVELTPGTYTLICNLEGGGSSHAARGQVVEVVIE